MGLTTLQAFQAVGVSPTYKLNKVSALVVHETDPFVRSPLIGDDRYPWILRG